MKLSNLDLNFSTLGQEARVHNKRREGEYPTSIVLPNALRKVMM